MKLKSVPTQLLLCAALAASAFASSARADNLSVGHYYTSSTSVPFVAQYADNAPVQGLSGVMALWDVQNQTTGKSFLAFCLEPAEAAVQTALSYTASAYVNTSVQKLYDSFYGSLLSDPNSADRAMGFQLALWELNGGPAVSSWELPSAAVVAEANNMLSVVNAPGSTTPQYTLTRWTNAGNQDVLQAAPVPEPETYALMAAGLAMVGAIVRRRSKTQR